MNIRAPNPWVHMFPVSVCKRKIDLKHSQKEGRGGLCPLRRYSLSWSHLGSALKWHTFHASEHSLMTACPAISSAPTTKLWTICSADSNRWRSDAFLLCVFIESSSCGISVDPRDSDRRLRGLTSQSDSEEDFEPLESSSGVIFAAIIVWVCILTTIFTFNLMSLK